MRREYEAQIEYHKHLEAFMDRWRYNANRAAQAQSKIKILEKVRGSLAVACMSRLNRTTQLPELSPPTTEETEGFRDRKSVV